MGFDKVRIRFAEALEGGVAAFAGGFGTRVVGSSVQADAEGARAAGTDVRELFEQGDGVAGLG